MVRKLIYAILILGILLCFSPMAAVLWATSFAEKHGCAVHEGFANSCLVNSTDWGDTLYTAFVSGWLMMFTFPVAILLALFLILFTFDNFILRLLRHR